MAHRPRLLLYRLTGHRAAIRQHLARHLVHRQTARQGLPRPLGRYRHHSRPTGMPRQRPLLTVSGMRAAGGAAVTLAPMVYQARTPREATRKAVRLGHWGMLPTP